MLEYKAEYYTGSKSKIQDIEKYGDDNNDRKFGGRYSINQHTLKVKKGAKVELTWNLNTELGLSHHTEGIIVDVLRKEGAEDILLVEFSS